ncbi:MAG: indole-3-glycerol phosphate synthase TrpC, partial [Acidimicrobiia bacterium]
VSRLREPTTLEALQRAAEAAPPSRNFTAALRRPDRRVAVIAEIKRRSPSKGVLAAELDAAATARSYEAGGAAALSVLTDTEFFGGSADDLRMARAATTLPVLRKDFTIDEAQLDEARAMQADAVLLIVRAFDDDRPLRDLHDRAAAVGLGVLVEAHDPVEIKRAVDIGAAVIGVNARDLASFNEDLGRVADLRALVPEEVIAVAESAIRDAADVTRMADAGFDAVLVGEALVRSAAPADSLRTLAEVPRSVR